MQQVATNSKSEETYIPGTPAIAWETAEARIKGLKEFLLNAPQKMATERLQYLKEAYEQYKGESPVFIRAKLFEKMVTVRPIFLDDNPIVGTLTGTRAGVNPYPEWNVSWIKDELDIAMMSHLGEVQMTEESRKLMRETYNAWKGHTNIDRANVLFKELYGYDAPTLFKSGLIFEGSSHAEGLGVADYPRVIYRGMASMIEEVEGKLKSLVPLREENKDQVDFWRAARIVLKAMITMAHRYADLAGETAAKEADPARRAELQEIAEVCRQVPEYPARTFREAVQAFWFVHLGLDIDQMGCATAPGRYGQYMYPLYKKDLEEGRLTREQAMTLLKFQFVKHLEIGQYQGLAIALQLSGHTGQTISLGGVTAEGRDATNDLELLLIDVQIAMRNIQPTLSLFYHDNIRKDILDKAVDLIRTGIGQPQIMNNDVCVQRNLNRWSDGRITLEDARNVANFGCVATGVCGKSSIHVESLVNIAKAVELTINNGWDPMTKKQIGPQTGNSEEFETFEEFYSAFEKQLAFAAYVGRLHSHVGIWVRGKNTPSPFRSVMIDGCIAKGIHEEGGGVRYPQSLAVSVGGIDAANALNAVRHLVYTRNSLSIAKLKEALLANFKGHEDIQKMCFDAPKHGNDYPDTDALTRRVYDDVYKSFNNAVGPNYFGDKVLPEAYSVSLHNYCGRLTGALPTGRQAGLPLTDGSVSAMPGTDVEGPTAFINSAARALDTVNFGANHCNMKFHPGALEGPAGTRMLESLIKSYCDQGGSHIQFNCVKAETLIEAQKDPAKYRDLVVRVAGFSAFFTRLDKAVQDEIIKRTEYGK